MRLSEAIRLGAMLRPQVVLFFFSNGASCALGAAAEASGVTYPDFGRVISVLEDRWPWIYAVYAPCPVCQDRRNMRGLVPHLNNAHAWTREEIAAFVATIEPVHGQTTEEPKAVAAVDPVAAK